MKSFIKIGLLTGLVVSAWNLSCFTIVSWLNKISSLGIPVARIRAYSGLIGIILLIIGIYFRITTLKKKNRNQISFAQAVKTGAFISIISALIGGFFAFIYCTVINPGYAAYMVKDAETALAATQNTPAEISRQLVEVRNRYSTSTQVLQALIAQSVMGTLGSLIIAAFVKTKKSDSNKKNI
ncbi:MAG TPA: DUF4199 domain-containing protein [Puia sp.]|nr:DUF4199 domain-containing protein [Puia sp.]